MRQIAKYTMNLRWSIKSACTFKLSHYLLRWKFDSLPAVRRK